MGQVDDASSFQPMPVCTGDLRVKHPSPSSDTELKCGVDFKKPGVADVCKGLASAFTTNQAIEEPCKVRQQARQSSDRENCLSFQTRSQIQFTDSFRVTDWFAHSSSMYFATALQNSQRGKPEKETQVTLEEGRLEAMIRTGHRLRNAAFGGIIGDWDEQVPAATRWQSKDIFRR